MIGKHLHNRLHDIKVYEKLCIAFFQSSQISTRRGKCCIDELKLHDRNGVAGIVSEVCVFTIVFE